MPSSKAQFVYHILPANLRGDVLYPLNQLKSTHPDLYELHAQKYAWRESRQKMKIPKLNCLWNDVLHFCPIHPNKIYQALCRVQPESVADRQFIAIPIERVIDTPAAIYHSPPPPLDPVDYDKDNQAPDMEIAEDAIVSLSSETFSKLLPEIPAATEAYYRFEYEHGRRPLLFYGIPHVLVQGAVDIGACQRIGWRAPLSLMSD